MYRTSGSYCEIDYGTHSYMIQNLYSCQYHNVYQLHSAHAQLLRESLANSYCCSLVRSSPFSLSSILWNMAGLAVSTPAALVVGPPWPVLAVLTCRKGLEVG